MARGSGFTSYNDPNRFIPPSPRYENQEIVRALTAHVGKEVKVGRVAGRLVHYGCPKCSIDFGVVYGDKCIVIPPGDVESVTVSSVEDSMVTEIVMKHI